MPKGLNFNSHEEGVQEASVGFDRNLLFVPGMYCPSGFDLLKILVSSTLNTLAGREEPGTNYE